MIRRVIRNSYKNPYFLQTAVFNKINQNPYNHIRVFASEPQKREEDSAEKEAKKGNLPELKSAESMWLRDISDKKITKYILYSFFLKNRSTRSEMFKMLWPHFKNKKNMALFGVALATMILSKGLAIGVFFN